MAETRNEKPGRNNAGNILVVDDDPEVREVLGDILRMDGYQVRLAETGKDAILVARSAEELDAILLDVKMPDMDGFEVIQELKKDPRSAEVPVLFVSAQVFDGDSIRRGLDLGARDYIPKPLNKPELLARISSVVRIHRMELELREKNRSLRELDRRRHEYLGMASHDLKVPLHSVATYCTVLLHGGYGALNDEQSKAIARVRAQVNYMKGLVANLLDLEKIETGSLSVEQVPVDIEGLFREALEMQQPIADERQVQLELDVDKEVGKRLLDGQKMMQIVNNLVGNAIKFAPEGARIVLGTRRRGAGFELWVADTGPGIPKAEQELLFRPFQQLSVKSTTRERGAGLGLCIVKNLVEIQGGSISVDSAPGRGSRFQITFPDKAASGA